MMFIDNTIIYSYFINLILLISLISFFFFCLLNFAFILLDMCKKMSCEAERETEKPILKKLLTECINITWAASGA